MTTGQRFAGRRIVISGAASGIGAAVAGIVIAEGGRPILLDRNGEGAAQVLGDADGMSAGVDVSDAGAVTQALTEAATRMGGIDAAVNAAGIMVTKPTEELTQDDWQRTIGVNLTGTFNVCHAAAPHLKASGGAIVNVSSATGLLPNAPGMVAYAASKGGVVAMTKALASDLAPAVRVNAVCPGLVDTPMGADFIGNTALYALKRPAQADEIARAIVFLISDDASYVTGSIMAVDGGRSFH